MSAPTDEQLLLDYLSGNQGSFELLVRRHTQELYHFVFRFTGNSIAAEDVVQETLVQLHTSAARFDTKRKLKPWLFTIAANKARDFLRRRDRRREVALEAEIDHESETGKRYLELFANDDEAPDDGIMLDEKRKIVKAIIDSMPVKLCEIIVLAYYHRFPYRDIAEITGIPLGTVKSRLHAAIAHFGREYRASVLDQVNHRE